MSTRAHIGRQLACGTIIHVYQHSDGYPEGFCLKTGRPFGLGLRLACWYNDLNKIESLIQLGGLSWLDKAVEPDPTRPHAFGHKGSQPGVTIAYHRDRGDPLEIHESRSVAEFVRNAGDMGAEFVYLWRDGQWCFNRIDTAHEGRLKKLEPHLITLMTDKPTHPAGVFAGLFKELSLHQRQRCNDWLRAYCLPEQTEARWTQHNLVSVLTLSQSPGADDCADALATIKELCASVHKAIQSGDWDAFPDPTSGQAAAAPPPIEESEQPEPPVEDPGPDVPDEQPIPFPGSSPNGGSLELTAFAKALLAQVQAERAAHLEEVEARVRQLLTECVPPAVAAEVSRRLSTLAHA